MSDPGQPKKILIFRLSSLGDVILATAALEALAGRAHPVHWVVRSEFASVLRGHPQIARLWEFDRQQGWKGWRRLCRELKREGFDEVLDLHGSLRTRAAQIFLGSGVVWTRISKGRLRRLGYAIFKKKWPKFWRPRAWRQVFSVVAGGTGEEKPNLRFLIETDQKSPAIQMELAEYKRRFPQKTWLAVMPSSRWEAKTWPVSHYAQLLERWAIAKNIFPVVLGGASDEASRALVAELKSRSIECASGVGRWSLPEVAEVLSQCRAYLGSDTGIFHFAESIGLPAWVLFGPTTADYGFGPWGAQSCSLGSTIGCRPCSKDGSACFRISRRYACLSELTVSAVEEQISDFF